MLNKQKLLFLLSVIMVTYSLICCSKHNKNPQENSRWTTVSVTVVKSESVNNTVSANGLIEPWQETIINAEIGGLDITKVYANTGDKVKKGQLLALLNPAQINADLLTQEANVAENIANLEKAKTEARQAKILEQAGAISAQELLSYVTTEKTSSAKLEAARAGLALKKLNLGYTRITAPDNGIISSRVATVGNVVQSGGELFRLIRNNHLEWKAEVSLDQLGNIKIGQQAGIETLFGHIITGTVSRIAPTLDNNSKSGVVYVELSNSDEVKVGMSLSGKISIGNQKNMLVPLRAIVNRDGFNYVFIISNSNQVHKTKVETGVIYNDMIIIYKGLQNGDKIVVDGASFLNESNFVNVSRAIQ